MKIKTHSNHRTVAAYTLTEIMIVVSIIGMLATMALPGMIKARENAQVNLILRNLREIDGAKERWALDNKKQQGDPLNDISELADYIRGGKVNDAAHEIYVLNPVGTPPGASLPPGVALGKYPAGGFIPAP